MPRILARERIPIEGRDGEWRVTLTQYERRSSIELRRFSPAGLPTNCGVVLALGSSPAIRAALLCMEGAAAKNGISPQRKASEMAA